MQSVIVIGGGSPCPACGGRYRFRTIDNVTLCISCRWPMLVQGAVLHEGYDMVLRGVLIRRTSEGFEIERLDRNAA